MRYALFEEKATADSFAAAVEAVINATPESRQAASRAIGLAGESHFVKYSAFIGWLGKYAVAMEIEPPTLRGEIVDTVEPPPPAPIE